jgi:peptidyl-tRNA hydrolase
VHRERHRLHLARLQEIGLIGLAAEGAGQVLGSQGELTSHAASAIVRIHAMQTDSPDPLRMYLVLRRGAIATLARAGELAGAAAVACLRTFGDDPEHREAIAQWRERPGKVCLRARTLAQWEQVLAEPHAIAGDRDGEAVVALAPRRRSQRGPLLERLQAMSTALDPPPARAQAGDRRAGLTYALNPEATMSSGKTVAQVAHAAVMADESGALEDWVAAGCPGRVLAPDAATFALLAAHGGCVARVVDAGLTEVPPGTITVVALAPGPADELPAGLRYAASG